MRRMTLWQLYAYRDGAILARDPKAKEALEDDDAAAIFGEIQHMGTTRRVGPRPKEAADGNN